MKVEARDDKEMMENPTAWPVWPVLPIKRRPKDGGTELAIMVHAEGRLTDVYLGDMFGFAEQGGTVAEILDSAEKIHYNSYDEIIADGWVVD
jgi:hypothetical protein